MSLIPDLKKEVEMAIITKEEYEEFERKSLFVDALLLNGIDNWSGYEDAMEMYNEFLEQFGYSKK